MNLPQRDEPEKREMKKKSISVSAFPSGFDFFFCLSSLSPICRVGIVQEVKRNGEISRSKKLLKFNSQNIFMLVKTF
jgi:hypothetical protein